MSGRLIASRFWLWIGALLGKTGPLELDLEGLIYLRQGHPDRALRVLERALQMCDPPKSVGRRLVWAQLGLGRIDEAVANGRKALLRDELDADTAFEIGSALARVRADRRSALEWFDTSISLDESFALGHLGRGHALLGLKAIDAAELAYEQVVKISTEPNLRLRARLGMSKCAIDRGDSDSALKLIESAIVEARQQGALPDEIAAARELEAWVRSE